MTSTDSANPRSAGRPRDAQIDRAVLDATRALLAEVGYQDTSISAVARRASVGTAPIYRRWPGKEALIEDAVFGSGSLWLPAETEDLHTDLIEWVRVFLARIAEPSARAAIPGLISAYHREPDRYRALHERADLPARQAFTARIRSAIPADGDGTATADLVFEILIARTLMRGLTYGMDDAETFCARTADALLSLIRTAT
ncbi:TetR/AcrR family transcriptional regulator [Nocardia pseudovaccinii]|uniref:TetR/AcrR family transcriptional regulator n=1 Tax=Nocardia pseudovaccinii TaxID=189540 RepID=UPI0007A42F50|nr:TetR/AcrR family transcriptional regulator [Nocardia pseudovaccinii]